MKTIRQAKINGGIARLLQTPNGFSAILIVDGTIVQKADASDSEKAWAALLRGDNHLETKIASRTNAIDNDKYSEVAQIVENTAGPILLTGRAGTGKTTFLRNFLENTQLKAVIIAPTGVAALNAGGQTAHSLFKLPPSLISPQDVRRTRDTKLLKSIDLLVIDEVSMVRADLMDAIDRSLRLHRGIAAPFGGVRLLCVGDSAQLPPIVNRDDAPILERWFGGSYFFDAPSASNLDWTIIELCHSFRQTEEHFLNILNRLRDGTIDDDDAALLNSRVCQEPPEAVEGSIILTTTNEAARRINDKEMAALNSRPAIYTSQTEGVFDERLFPTDSQLEIKVGAKVMLLRNDADRRWVNGSLATVVETLEDTVKVKIGRYTHEVEVATWDRFAYEIGDDNEPTRKTIGSFKQLPLRPAWALTIHKAQGLTFDKVHVDFGRGAFAHGHTYVALSRCRSMSGLTMSRNIRPSDVHIDRRAFAIYDKADFQDFGDYRVGKIEPE